MTNAELWEFLKDFKSESREDMQIIFQKLDRMEREFQQENSELREEFHIFKGRAFGFMAGMSVVLGVVINVGIALYNKG